MPVSPLLLPIVDRSFLWCYHSSRLAPHGGVDVGNRLARGATMRSLLVLAVLLLAASWTEAEWQPYSVNLNAFSSGTDISTAVPGITLTSAYVPPYPGNGRDVSVYAFDNGGNMVFAPSSTGDQFYTSAFSLSEPTLQTFKVQFSQATDFVSVEAVNCSGLTEAIRAVAKLTSGQSVYFSGSPTRSLTRASRDIVQVELRPYGVQHPDGIGAYGAWCYFDNLTFNADITPEPSSFALLFAGAGVAIVFYITRRKKTFLMAAGVLVVAFPSQARAEMFTHNFDMFQDYNQYLYSTKNAQVRTEGDGVTRYWCPTGSGVNAEVIYGYTLQFPIQSASLYACLLAINASATTYLDVSPDATTWTTVGSGYLHPPLSPIDVSDILRGSESAYVRARLYSSSSSTYAQFIRTAPYIHAPDVYQFQASDTPEPSTLALLCGGLIALALGRKMTMKIRGRRLDQ